MALSASFWGANADPVQPVPPRPQQPQPSSGGGGGLGGFLYGNIIKPVVDSTLRGGQALTELQNTGHISNPKQFLGDVVTTGTTFAPVGKAKAVAEGGLGLLGKLWAGAKMGAGAGAATGGATAFGQGKSGGDVINSALLGGGIGAIAGAGMSGVGAALGKLSGKGKLSATVPAKSGNSMADRAATSKAQNAYTQQYLEHFGNPGTDTEGINPVLKDMQTHGLEPSIQHMDAYSKAGNGIEGVKNYLLDKHGQPMPVDINSIIDSAIKSQPGLGRDTKAVTQGLRSMLNDTLNPNGNISGKYSPQDVYAATKALYKAKSSNPAMVDAFKHARTSLTNILNNEGGLSKTISEYKLPTVEEAKASGATLIDPTDHGHTMAILDAAGGNESLADSQIAKINAATKFQDLQKAQLPHIRAGEIAQSAVDAVNSAPPKITGKSGGDHSLSTVYEAGSLAHGNVAAIPALGAKAMRSGPVQNALARFGKADMEQVGPTVAPELGARSVPVTAQPSNTQGAIDHIVPPNVKNAIVNAPSNVASAIGSFAQGARNTLGSPQNLVPAGAGAGVNQTEQVPGGLDTSSVDQVTQQPTESTGTISDGSDIPGGTLQDLQAELQADPKNANVYEQIYADAQKQIAGSGIPKLNATQAKNLTNIQNATAALHNYVSGLNELSNNTRGAGVGHLSALMGKFGLGGADATGAASLEAAKPELAIQLAQAMNNGQKAPQGLTKEIEGMLPSVGDSKALAEQKIQRIAENLSSYLKIAATASTSDRTSGDTSSVLQALGIGASSDTGQ